jgi:hypothetical protein
VVAQLRSIVGAAQGTGGEQVVDAARLLPLIKHVRSHWQTTNYPQLPEWLERAHRVLSTGLESAVEDQWRIIQRLALRIEELVGDSDAAELVAALEEALNAARSADVVTKNADEVKTDLNLARNLPWKSWTGLRTGTYDDLTDEEIDDTQQGTESDSASVLEPTSSSDTRDVGDAGVAAPWGRRFALVSEDRRRSTQQMQDFLTTYDSLLQATALRVERQLEAQPVNPLNDFTNLLNVLDDTLTAWKNADA